MKLKRAIYIAVGSLSFAIGCVGIVVPLLPSFPFFLLTLICYARSSKRLHDRFVASKYYKKHLEPFLHKKGMTWRTKLQILGMVTLLMGFGFIMMKRAPVGRIILAIVWAGHVLYFLFGIPLRKEEETGDLCTNQEVHTHEEAES